MRTREREIRDVVFAFRSQEREFEYRSVPKNGGREHRYYAFLVFMQQGRLMSLLFLRKRARLTPVPIY